jgi:serine/threonine-protein kinase RsbW
MAGGEQLLLKVPAEADNVAVIREAVGTRAQELGLGEPAIDDLKTVVSEACANIVLHAYPDDARRRPIEVEMGRTERAVNVVVRDQGIGIRPAPGPKPPSLRLGLQLIGAIASCFQIRSGRDRGTELVIQLPLPAES